jgi:hypothetical protein
MRESEWISVHAFFHGDLDHMLTDMVAPLINDLRADELVSGSFFLRYWDGGPHLRLRVLPSTEQARERVRAVLAERLDRYFAEHPSADAISNAAYQELARSMARWERVPEHLPHLRRNNSYAFIPYQREVARYGEGDPAGFHEMPLHRLG